MVPQTLPPETVVGSRFTIEQLLGHGGLGSLYLAVDRDTNERVALRVLASDLARSEVALDQLRAQVRLSSKLAHKNVARLFGMGKHSSLRYLACEYIDGHSLREVIAHKRRSGKVFSLKSAYNVIAHACNALRAALMLGLDPPLYHGLPGPGAIRISRAGRVKLCDFGLVCALPAGSAALGRLGDVYCMAPDLKLSPASTTPAADIYTLGATLYEMLCGHPPTDPYTPLVELVPQLPAAADQIVMRCLQTDPGLRFATPEDLKAAVYRVIEATSDSSNAAAYLDENASAPIPALTAWEPEALDGAFSANKMSGHTGAPAYDVGAAATLDAGAVAAPPAAHRGPIQAPPSRPAVPGALGLLTPLTTGPAVQAPGARLEDLLAEPIPDDAERWLVRHNGLDFGPFTLGDLKQQLYRGDFSGQEELVDQESGKQVAMRHHAALEMFVRLLEVHRQNEAIERARAEGSHRAKRRRAVLVTTVSLSVVAVAAAGVVWYVLNSRKPEVVVREVPGKPSEVQLKLDITWKNESAQTARRSASRRARKARARAGAAGSQLNDEHETHLGDVSQAGGDQLLSQQQIQSVMERNVQKLARCVIQQARRDPSLRSIAIDFGVKGSGLVSYVKVNGEGDGPFHACIAKGMQSIRFPSYDGSMTRASFAMNINR